MSHLAPAVLVYEKQPRLESELKRDLAASRTLVRPCRSTADLMALARAMPGSVALLDFAAGGDRVLQWLEQALAARLAVTPVIVCSAEKASFEWPLRELGARAVLAGASPASALATLCTRLLGDMANSTTD